MRSSESIVNIAPALLKAQKEIGSAKKESENPFYRSAYADLGEVMRVCKKPCNDNGISIIQPVDSDESGVYVDTTLLHESGEFISSRMRLAVKADNDPQALGSAISYAKRYSLQAMLLIPSEDDDGEKATDHNANPVSRQNNGASQRSTQTSETPQRPLEGQASEAQIKAIFAISKGKGMTEADVKAKFNIASISGLTKQQASDLITSLNSL